MGRLMYSMMTTLDGYVADADGDFGWEMPDDAELHRYAEEITRPVRTYLYGRRMYETMVFWETAHDLPDAPDFIVEYAKTWQAADKIVYSRTLGSVSSERTRLVREFDPAAVQELKDGDGDLTVDGPGLAAAALQAGLVDEIGPIVVPVVVGGGTPFLPPGLRLRLELVDERRFDKGAVHLRYRVR
ncbi:dihydrofolate reductase family protein [Actinomycetospora straminea]|uniref:Dihydrofolate reductase family protein n=1 Tax=Actinomycetospora straminea TaxID=663607 RepID=A0ABP9F1B8_9PSEU|nr:dihydrofolate reductase family protein [Actinomycetospora straminea]MDD7934700.1 dihydrofolate reductase family protein [Actinomycetospora straminea]